jgi:hypothetical protein
MSECPLTKEQEESCPLLGGNPKEVACPFANDIEESKVQRSAMKTDISWLKKGYWIQAAFSIGTFLAVTGILYKAVTG